MRFVTLLPTAAGYSTTSIVPSHPWWAPRGITPRLNVAERPVPGPPKRFAQAIGLVFSVSAAVLALGFGLMSAAYVVLGLLIVAATLESVFGLCLGCKAFAILMRAGVIPKEVCERCNNISAELPQRV